MRTDTHISLARTEVREGSLPKHAAIELDAGRLFAIAGGLGLPRSWPLATAAALEGFVEGIEKADAEGERGMERVHEGLRGARAALARTCDRLVERLLPDASLVAFGLSDGQLHVMSAGSGRVYLRRGGRPERLTSREAQPGGLLRARPSQCGTPVEPGDLIMAGSVSAFSTRAIAKVMQVLDADTRARPSTLATLLTDPAKAAGVGAAAVVVRVR